MTDGLHFGHELRALVQSELLNIYLKLRNLCESYRINYFSAFVGGACNIKKISISDIINSFCLLFQSKIIQHCHIFDWVFECIGFFSDYLLLPAASLTNMGRFKSVGPSDARWRQRSGSTLAQVMACCLTAPSHYLNQCWLIISKVLWHSSEGIIMRRSEDTNQ